jgi:serine/threonine protein kinase
MNNYRTIRELGRGASGIVSLVRRKSDNRLFAAKQVYMTAVDPSEAVAERNRVMKEARLLQQLPHHPSIIALEDVIDARDSVTLIMEYVDGGSLYDAIYPDGAGAVRYSPPESQGGWDDWGDGRPPPGTVPERSLRTNASRDMSAALDPLPEERILQWVFQLANAIHFLHSNGIVHRDLKLNNVLITSASQIVKIADFGVADASVSSTGKPRLSMTTVGTPQYFSPEMCDGKPYDGKADVWALGVMAYEMCCRRSPFNAGNVLALADAIVNQTPPRIDPFYSDGLDTIVRQMLEKSPSVRPSAEAVVSRVKMLRQGASVAQLHAAHARAAIAAVGSPPPGKQVKQPSQTDEEARREAYLEAKAAAQRNKMAAALSAGQKSPPQDYVSATPPIQTPAKVKEGGSPPSDTPIPVRVPPDPSPQQQRVVPSIPPFETPPRDQQHRDPSPAPQDASPNAVAAAHSPIIAAQESKIDFSDLHEIQARNRARLDAIFPDTPRDQPARTVPVAAVTTQNVGTQVTPPATRVGSTQSIEVVTRNAGTDAAPLPPVVRFCDTAIQTEDIVSDKAGSCGGCCVVM